MILPMVKCPKLAPLLALLLLMNVILVSLLWETRRGPVKMMELGVELTQPVMVCHDNLMSIMSWGNQVTQLFTSYRLWRSR